MAPIILKSGGFVPQSVIRDQFSKSMSNIYQAEVPLYSSLVSGVSEINNITLSSNPDLKTRLTLTDELSRLDIERHGAIRLGTASELQIVSRFLSIMGMEAVGYYDLSQAGLPVHATCFRTTDLVSLAYNPFRLFTSLLRPELIPEPLRSSSLKILSRREMFSKRVVEIINTAESQGGLFACQVADLIALGLEAFKWRAEATITHDQYLELLKESPLLADIVAFSGPHINHLTPRTLDIDEVQYKLTNMGFPMKNSIEGPPWRKNPILLRQTSFKALEENIFFRNGSEVGKMQGVHTARFGEVEQRGAALTPKGRKLYDSIMDATRESNSNVSSNVEIFAAFPDDLEVMRTQGLAWFRYFIIDTAQRVEKIKLTRADHTIDELVFLNLVKYEPLVYEDFLPLSAAGIFQSNIAKDGDGPTAGNLMASDGRADFETALQGKVKDEMDLYHAIQLESINACIDHYRMC